MMSIKILLATNGSQGVVALRELYALGFDNDDITILTFNSKFNKPFIEFLNFNNKEFYYIENNKQLNDFFEDKSFDILLSISFRFIFSKESLSKIRVEAINFHPGILPDYKGSFSIPWAIINNEEYVGYTYHRMIENVDCGQILLQEKFEINNQNAHTLNYLIFQRGISKLGKILKLSQLKEKVKIDKPDESGKFYPNCLPYNGEINKNWNTEQISRFIKAMYFPPFDAAYFMINGEAKYFNTFEEYQLFIKS